VSLSAAQIRTLQDAMESDQRSLGVFEAVNMHEPKSAPQLKGVSASTWIQSLGPARGGSGLSSTTLRMAYRTRVYVTALGEQQDMIDPRVVFAAGRLMEAYSADYDLGGRVRCVDLLGTYGEPLAWQAGYLNLEGKFYRVVDVNVPLILNDVWDQSA
jgi:hypothetical protein